MEGMDAASVSPLFDIPPGITYLNVANLSPQLRAVTAVGMEAAQMKATPWRMTGESWFSSAEDLRGLVGQLLGSSADSIAFIPAVSYGMAIAAANVPIRQGASIVLLEQDFPSNVYAWEAAARKHGAEVVTVARRPADGPRECCAPSRPVRRSSQCRPATSPTARQSTSSG